MAVARYKMRRITLNIDGDCALYHDEEGNYR